MKYFVLAALCITIVSAQYHNNGDYGRHQASGGYSYKGYGGQQASGSVSSGHSLANPQYLVDGTGHSGAGVSSDSYGHGGHRFGRSVSVLPIISHAGVEHLTGGYTNSGHRLARSLVALASVAEQGSYSSLGSSTGYYGSYAGHGHRMVRSPVGAYGGAAIVYSNSRSQGAYPSAGHQHGSISVLHGKTLSIDLV